MYQANNLVVPMLEMHGLNVLDSVVAAEISGRDNCSWDGSSQRQKGRANGRAS